MGGDDFIVLTSPESADVAAKLLCERFDESVALLYDRVDHDRGYIEVEDRRGTPARFPILSVSVGVATTRNRTFTHYGEAVSVATEMKQYAKRTTGSSFSIDRRVT